MATERSTTDAAAPKVYLSWVRQALTFLGVAGAGGGGFAVLCFGIGYLAVRSHDEMLGLPSRSTAYSAMVRMGALFFPNSLYYAFDATYDALVVWWKPIAILSAVTLGSWLFKDALATALHRHASRVPAALRSWWVGTRLPLAHTLLLAWALLLGGLLFETRAATLHRTNRHLLLDTAELDADKAPYVPLIREVERSD